MTDSTAPESSERHVKFVPLDELRGDPRNPKNHSLDTIDSSFDRFGLVDLISVDARTGYIISGHGRTTVLKDIYAKGEPAPEGVKVAEDGTWLVPVNSGWASKNDAEAAAALIALNRVTEMGGWVDDALLGLLDEISASGAGFEGIGYDESDMDDLRLMLDQGGIDGEEPTGAPGAADYLEPGEDQYQEQYGVTVICADETEQEAIYRRLQAEGLTVKVVTV